MKAQDIQVNASLCRGITIFISKLFVKLFWVSQIHSVQISEPLDHLLSNHCVIELYLSDALIYQITDINPLLSNHWMQCLELLHCSLLNYGRITSIKLLIQTFHQALNHGCLHVYVLSFAQFVPLYAQDSQRAYPLSTIHFLVAYNTVGSELL